MHLDRVAKLLPGGTHKPLFVRFPHMLNIRGCLAAGDIKFSISQNSRRRGLDRALPTLFTQALHVKPQIRFTTVLVLLITLVGFFES
jgi:hypothetical protein